MQSILIKLICSVLGKGLAYTCARDSRAFEIFKLLPKELTVSIGVFGEKPYLKLVKTSDQILKVKDNKETDLKIEFKNRKSAKKVLLGGSGVAESFARHDILLKGNINTAVLLVNIIDLCEYYLFPRFITKKFLPKMKKEFCSIKIYGFVLFGSAKKLFIENVTKQEENKKTAKPVGKNAKSDEKVDKTSENLEKEGEISG